MLSEYCKGPAREPVELRFVMSSSALLQGTETPYSQWWVPSSQPQDSSWGLIPSACLGMLLNLSLVFPVCQAPQALGSVKCGDL